MSVPIMRVACDTMDSTVPITNMAHGPVDSTVPIIGVAYGLVDYTVRLCLYGHTVILLNHKYFYSRSCKNVSPEANESNCLG